MAVQKSRKSPSRRDMRRAHDALSSPTLTADSGSGALRRRHHIGADGFYRGKQIIQVKGQEADD